MKEYIVNLKKEINICTVVAPHTGGLRSAKNSRYLRGYCPWCQPNGQTKRKSNRRFWVDTELKICNCHKCKFDLPMDVFNFYARLYNISNLDAIQELQNV